MSQDISILQIILEKADFSHRDGYLSVPISGVSEAGNVTVAVETQVNHEKKHAVVRLRVSNGEQVNERAPLYNFDVSMVALIAVSDGPFSQDDIQGLSLAGAVFLVPFVRENVANLTGKGRFGPIWIQPVPIVNLLQSLTASHQVNTGKGDAKLPPPRRLARKKKG